MEPRLTVNSLKGHSQLWDRADLDTSFLTLPPTRIQIWKSAPIFAVFCLIFNRLLCFWVSFCSSYDIIYAISGQKQYMQISYEMVSNAHVRQVTVSLQYGYLIITATFLSRWNTHKLSNQKTPLVRGTANCHIRKSQFLYM